jgi:aminotransferase
MGALTDMGFTYGLPGGAFYIYTNISRTGMPAPQFCEALLQEARVLIFPGSMFGDDSDDYIRISYVQPIARIMEAADRIRAFMARL